MRIIVGNTGFVGSNIAKNMSFDGLFNSKNISDAYSTKPDLCVFSGIRAEKFFANKNPENDLEKINEAISNIKLINPKKLVLISTIDVLKDPDNVDESVIPDSDGLEDYGKNRLYFENRCREIVNDCHIIRLPGLFGINLKKNFIYDILHRIPNVLNKTLFEELTDKNNNISLFYELNENGFYIRKSDSDQRELFDMMKQVGFSSLNFTDSRSKYQFYNLDYLAGHILKIIENDIPLMHMAVEPVSADEIYKALTGEEFENVFARKPADYNFKTMYSELFGGENGYLFSKQCVTDDIVEYVRDNRNEFSSI